METLQAEAAFALMCDHRQPTTKLMVCTSASCQEEDRIGCRSCFLIRHIHGEVVEFRRVEEIQSKLQPFKSLIALRKLLEQRLEAVYSKKLQEFEETLKRDKARLQGELAGVLPAGTNGKISAFLSGGCTDLELYQQLCSLGIANCQQACDPIRDNCQRVADMLSQWEKLSASTKMAPLPQLLSLAQPQPMAAEAVSPKRPRNHLVEEPNGNSHKQFKKQHLAEPSNGTILSQANPALSERKPAATSTSGPVPQLPNEAIGKIPLASFEAGVRQLQEVQYNEAVDMEVNETEASDPKSGSLTKFIHSLCRLEKVENLRLRIGKSTDLTPGLLKKIDDTVSCLPRLQHFAFEGWSSEPNCKASNFQETRKRIRNDRNVTLVLRRLDFLIE